MSLSSIILLRIAFASLIIPLIQKQIADLPGRVERMWWQYAFTSLLVCIIILAMGESVIHPACLLVAAFGIPNAIAYYAYLRAINISQSKSAIFSPLIHIVSIGLAIILLDEWKFLSPAVCLGVVLSLLGATMIAARKGHTSLKESKSFLEEQNNAFWKYVGFYTLVWGIGLFLMKVFSEIGVSKYSFVFWWYLGSFFGATLLKFRVKEQANVLPWKGVAWMFFLASFLILGMFLTYWSYELAPMVVIQPIYQIAGIFGTLFIGLVLFRERGLMTRREWIGIGSGSCGAIVIAISLSGI